MRFVICKRKTKNMAKFFCFSLNRWWCLPCFGCFSFLENEYVAWQVLSYWQNQVHELTPNSDWSVSKTLLVNLSAKSMCWEKISSSTCRVSKLMNKDKQTLQLFCLIEWIRALEEYLHQCQYRPIPIPTLANIILDIFTLLTVLMIININSLSDKQQNKHNMLNISD